MKHSAIMLAAWALVGCLSNLAWGQQAAESRPVSAATLGGRCFRSDQQALPIAGRSVIGAKGLSAESIII